MGEVIKGDRMRYQIHTKQYCAAIPSRIILGPVLAMPAPGWWR